MLSVRAGATAFIYLTLSVPIAQFTIVDEPGCFFGGISVGFGCRVSFSLYSLHISGRQLLNNSSL